MKKLTFITTAVLVVLSMISCSSTKTMSFREEFLQCYKIRKDKYVVNERYAIVFVKTKAGDTVAFSPKFPGRVLNTGVFGNPILKCSFDGIDSAIFHKSSLEFIWKKGVKYSVLKKTDSGYLCVSPETVNIQLDKIDYMKVNESNTQKIILRVFGVTALVFITNAIITILIISIHS